MDTRLFENAEPKRFHAQSLGPQLALYKTVFQEPWWCEASVPGEWDVAEYREDNKVVGRFVYAIRKKSGIVKICMPPMARVMMPEIVIDQKKDVTILLRKIKIIYELLHRLPNFYLFKYALPPNSGYEMPFSLNGFDIKVEYTFCGIGTSTETLIENMDQKVRNIVKKNRSRYSIEAHTDFDRYIRLSHTSFARCGVKDRTQYQRLQRIFEACVRHNRTVILTARDDKNEDVASAILLWDDRSLYYWRSVRTKDQPNNANSLLILAAQDYANGIGVTFDMDSFGKPSSGLFLSKFGLKPKRRIIVQSRRPIFTYLANGFISPHHATKASPLVI